MSASTPDGPHGEHRTPAGPPIERKVWAGTGGSAAGLAVAGLVIYVLDAAVYRSGPVPGELSGPLLVLLPIALTFVGGYIAPHTFRSDPAAIETGIDGHIEHGPSVDEESFPPEPFAPDETSGVLPPPRGTKEF